MDSAVKYGFGQEIDKFTLHHSLHRTRTECRIVTLLGHIVLERLSEFNLDTVRRKLVLKVLHLYMKNVADIILGKRLEHYDLIDTVQEFRPYGLTQEFKYLALALFQHLGSLSHVSSLLCRSLTFTSDFRKFLHIALKDVRADI